MKSLREFWKLIKRKKKKPEIEYREKPDPDQQAKLDSFSESPGLHEKTSTILIKKKARVHIQVGLDFGTSATKVIFSQLGRRPFRVVNFNHNLPDYPSYCIPSVGCIDGNNRLLLGVDAAKLLLKKEWDTGLQRLKVVVAGKYDDSFKDPITEEKYFSHFKDHNKKYVPPEMLTALFLAYVIGNTRKIIKNYPQYRNSELDFAFNVCMPIDHVENSKLKQVFERVFTWAELIENEWAKSKGGFSPLKVARATENQNNNRERKIFAVPESVASFASYLISLRKKEGLHAVIDLGAGTTDLSICNLFLDAGNLRNYWYAARNLPHGSIRIERAMALMITESSGKHCTSDDISKCLGNLESTLDMGKISEKNNKLNNVVFNELCKLKDSKDYKQTWSSAYSHLSKDTLWEDVEIFVCGGGSNFPYVDHVFSRPWWQHLKKNYTVSKLPIPDNYEPGISEAPFERMSVAYGLTIPLPQLEEFTLPDDSPDHTPKPPPVKSFDHEDLYPKD